jgi:hypothetical protein
MFAAALMATGCGLDPGENVNDPPPPPPPASAKQQGSSFAKINQTLQGGCAFSVCHSPHGMASSGGLDLSQDVWLSVINVPVHNAKAKAQGMALIKPCDPEHSLLYIKLALPKDDPDYGARMPASNDPMSAEDLKRIHDWIARGALLSEPESATGTVCKY